jgi:hypothetical protein
MRPVSAIVSTAVDAGRTVVFNHIVPIDLTTIFTGYGLLPAVISTKNQTGDWDAVGQKRTVVLSDGSSARELVTGYEPAQFFSYSVSEFTGALHYIARSVEGMWWFSENSQGQTEIKWQYAFIPRSIWTLPVLWLISKTIWRAYMRKALAQAVIHLQQGVMLHAT